MRKRFLYHLLVVFTMVFLVADVAVNRCIGNDATGLVKLNGGLAKVVTQGVIRTIGSAALNLREPALVERLGQEGFQIRIKQAVSHPMLGTGFGASAEVVCSSEAPWSYESTDNALAYKLVSSVCSLPGYRLGWRLLRQFCLAGRQWELLVVALGFLLIGGANP